MRLDRSHEQESGKVSGPSWLARVDVQSEKTRWDKEGGEGALLLGWSGEHSVHKGEQESGRQEGNFR